MWQAHTALKQGNAKEAQRMLRRLAEARPDSALLHMYLGWTNSLINPRAVVVAEKCLLEASRLEPENPNPFLLLAEVNTRAGNKSRAAEYEARAAALGIGDAAPAAEEDSEPEDVPVPGKRRSIASYLKDDDEIDMNAELRQILKDYDAQEKPQGSRGAGRDRPTVPRRDRPAEKDEEPKPGGLLGRFFKK